MSFGSLQFGKYGRKETIGCLMSKSAQLIRWSTRLNRLPLRG
ncbi:hypothetical protein MtrunA17_Chr2g0327071 [Medicago truncatula]|uniref:Uncharacterized protein n=1 Tax=Medicago truncatula TaxID=3880 RepID=A0A396JGZ1_MEDTR|nr:hypothetical protein MtrunA17_Chr2g0327071 [Medicago truncatula]